MVSALSVWDDARLILVADPAVDGRGAIGEALDGAVYRSRAGGASEGSEVCGQHVKDETQNSPPRDLGQEVCREDS